MNLEGAVRILSNRESWPFSLVIRENKKVPTMSQVSFHLNFEHGYDKHLVAQIPTNAVRTSCLQSQNAPCAKLLPCKLFKMLGHGNDRLPAPVAALARRTGR